MTSGFAALTSGVTALTSGFLVSGFGALDLLLFPDLAYRDPSPQINYHKIQYAQLCINENEGCEFIATNLDAVTHLTDAQEWAGNGAMTGAIKGCTGREPTLVGKPSPLMIDYIVDKYGCNRERICMVGDRLDTDILFGQNNGLLSCLTLSGVTTEEKLLSEGNQIKPDYYVGSIAEFM